MAEDDAAYGGPYIPASMGRRTSGLIHKVFGIRSCKETLNGRRARPCLQHQIGRCLAPCVVEVCAPERYRQAVDDARLFLEGRTDEVVKRLKSQMEAAASVDRFEAALWRGPSRARVESIEATALAPTGRDGGFIIA